MTTPEALTAEKLAEIRPFSADEIDQHERRVREWTEIRSNMSLTAENVHAQLILQREARYIATIRQQLAHIKHLEAEGAVLLEDIKAAFDLVDQYMGDTDPIDAEHPLTAACQHLAPYIGDNPKVAPLAQAFLAKHERMRKALQEIQDVRVNKATDDLWSGVSRCRNIAASALNPEP